MESPFILDRINASLMDGKAGMKSGKLRPKATRTMKMAGRQAGRQAGKYNLKEDHICTKSHVL
jgi:hypothetical protein